MDELEFCVKSLSYPLGMLIEGLERRRGDIITVSRGRLYTMEMPFAALCYLTALMLFNSLDQVDRKRLGNDYSSIYGFGRKLLGSKLGERLKPYLKSPGKYIGIIERLAIPWLEFEERKMKVEPYLKKLKLGEIRDRNEFLRRSDFLKELSVDEALLLSYIVEEPKKKELVNAALGKHNPSFREAAKAYFTTLRG
ncbi:hypothetical protein [Thermococcus sp. Bubb.Bath]|uniref:hypothetical protein n=1 Tax=Thermococcus sp. Bubb.Bath TaxID=1638242 RepID=UPI00143A43D1|nr:hypothetical protein [Thermococcus sp. Bubb.Bath]NJF25293.1 hypothetical protein [Thermococcus sp. Bubb.Bath]